ncbi:UPF0693 protein like protein [Myotis brandtii]|uniref:BLOC-1-related complex subunit 7 n=2 Tax=Laurasiatheria TaxID=314145 RepID=S7NDB2_MYOBR|nr:UPF0693 protein like protein [Myotis brandtii]
MATGAPDSQARFGQSVKGLLTEKVNTCGTDVIALTKQVLKGSRSSELLGQAARNMVLQEDAILHSEDSLRKMAIITTHLQYQQEAIQKKLTVPVLLLLTSESSMRQSWPCASLWRVTSVVSERSLETEGALKEELLFKKNHKEEVNGLQNQTANSGLTMELDGPKSQDLRRS